MALLLLEKLLSSQRRTVRATVLKKLLVITVLSITALWIQLLVKLASALLSFAI